jgi:hypothetical protein
LTEGCCPAAGGDVQPIVEELGGEPTVVLFPAAEGDVELLGEKPGGAPDVNERQEGPAGGPAEVAGPMSGTPGVRSTGGPNRVRRRSNRWKARIAGGTYSEER